MSINHLNGTIIISSLKTNKEFIYNYKRSIEGFLPASTFKIVNTLISLQEEILKDEREIIKWDGKNRGMVEWNKDQNILSAFPTSCVWFYQELAKRVGKEKYEFYFQKMNYGNMKTGDNVTTFWLDGDLRISAMQQIELLKNIYYEKYPFDKKNYSILKNVMIVEKTNEYTLRAKTGWTMRVNPQIGWYVGYIETVDDVWVFSCNLDITKTDDAEFREAIIYNALRELKVIK
jgi:beta-lactamase class D